MDSQGVNAEDLARQSHPLLDLQGGKPKNAEKEGQCTEFTRSRTDGLERGERQRQIIAIQNTGATSTFEKYARWLAS